MSDEAWILFTGVYENRDPESIHMSEEGALAHGEKLEAAWRTQYKDRTLPDDCHADVQGPFPVLP